MEEINYRILNLLENQIPRQEFERIAENLQLRSDYNYKGERIPTKYGDLCNGQVKADLNVFDNEENATKLLDAFDWMYRISKQPKSKSFVLNRIKMNKGTLKTPWDSREQQVNEYFSKFKRNKTIFGHSSVIVWAFDMSNKFIITGGEDFKVKVWLIVNGSLQGELIYHQKVVNDLIITNWNTFIISCDDEGWIWIWSLKEMQLVMPIKSQCSSITHLSIENYYSEKLHKDMSILICWGQAGYIWMYDINEIKKIIKWMIYLILIIQINKETNMKMVELL